MMGNEVGSPRWRSQGSEIDWRRSLASCTTKIREPLDAFREIRRGDTLFVSSACAEPQHLVRRLREYAQKLWDVKVVHLLGSGQVSFDDPGLADHIRFNCFFIGANTRAAVASGQADYTPVTLSEIPQLIRNKQVNIDVALIQVTPPDEHGVCSLGVSVETVKAAVEKARFVIAQMNPRMPWVGGDSLVSVERLDAIVPCAEELLTFAWPPPNEVSRQIAFHVARLIDDGATLQIGIGKIPNAILSCLGEKKDLGVHTETFSDSLVDLLETGVITNDRKGLHEGVVVASFCVGSARLYDYLDGNPRIELYPADYASDPAVIARNRKMTAINGAFEIDFTGQVCADSIGHRFYSGFGSQVDFMRGAARSPGGKPIIVLPSTAKNGAVSRIVPSLTPGAGVVLTRSDVHYVVTEYGIAYLYGKSIRERTLALIEIAHPKFRRELLDAAKAMHYLYPDQTLHGGSGFFYPEQWCTTGVLKDGMPVNVRPIRPRDEPLLQELYYSMSNDSIVLRFNSPDARFPHRRVAPQTIVDYYDQMAIVVTVGEVGREKILGVATYHRNPVDNIAECSFTVRDDHRRQGIGSLLLRQLMLVARACRVAGFRVEVLAKNRPMLNLFTTIVDEKNTRDGIHIDLDDDMYSLWYYFA